MIRLFVLLLLVVFIAGSAAAQQTQQEQKPAPFCLPVKEMAKFLIVQKGLAYLSDAIDSDDEVHMWFVNAKTGSWVQIHVKENLEACVEREGYDWHFAAGG